MKTANIWEYKVGNNGNIAKVAHLWKPLLFIRDQFKIVVTLLGDVSKMHCWNEILGFVSEI